MPPFKSIAISPTKRAGGRKAPSPTVGQQVPGSSGLTLDAALARRPRHAGMPSVHLYRVGDHLKMNGGGQLAPRAAGGCEVIALLPYEGRGALLYRVRSEAEAFERIVSEADLDR